MDKPPRELTDKANWKCIEANGLFRISVPDEWVWKLGDSPLLLIDGPPVQGSGIFIDYRRVVSQLPDDQVQVYLLELSKRFLEMGIAEATHDAISSANSAFWVESRGTRLRTFVKLENGHEWVVDFVLSNDRTLLFILHWNGPANDLMNFIIPILDTFEFDDQETDTVEVS